MISEMIYIQNTWSQFILIYIKLQSLKQQHATTNKMNLSAHIFIKYV